MGREKGNIIDTNNSTKKKNKKSKKRGREEEPTSTRTTEASRKRKNGAKKRDVGPTRGNESSGAAGGVFDFPWSRDGPASKGYYDDGYDGEECRLEFDDLFAGRCDLGLDCSPFFVPMSDFSACQTTATTMGSDGGDSPNLHGKIVDQSLDGIWSSVLDHPLHDNIISL